MLRDIAAFPARHETIAAFRLMWLTLARPSEVIEAKWCDFDLEAGTWRIPAERMQRRKEHTIPLPTQAIDLLRTLHGVTGGRVYLFPGRDDRTKPIAGGTFRQALGAIGWAGRYAPHATRTTGGTHLNEMGYPSDWIEWQFAHVEPNAVRHIDNHAEHLSDRAKMMQCTRSATC